MKKSLIFLPFLILFTLISCNGLGVESTSSNSTPAIQPTDSSLIGTWVVDDKSYEIIKEKVVYNGQEMKLVFSEDSTFKAYNFIDFWDLFGKNKRASVNFHDASGKWMIVNEKGYWKLKMSFDSGKLYQNGMGTTYDLFQQDSLVTAIQFYTDDPDSGDRMRFIRTENEY